MSTNYREAALVCPECREALEPASVGDAIIDVCAACGGVWVDWFDGDLVVMVRGAPKGPTGTLPERSGSAVHRLDSACPRCKSVLAAELYLSSTAEILRCSDCAGAFVPRASTSTIAGLRAEGELAEKHAPHRLIEVLRRWLGWDADNR